MMLPILISVSVMPVSYFLLRRRRHRCEAEDYSRKRKLSNELRQGETGQGKRLCAAHHGFPFGPGLASMSAIFLDAFLIQNATITATRDDRKQR